MNNKFVLTILVAIFCWGCGTSVVRENPNTADEVTADWDIKDINIIADKMIQSLNEHPLAHRNPSIVILVVNVRNKTYEHIETKAITDTVVTGILKSGRFKVRAEKEIRPLLEQEMAYKKAVEMDEDPFSLKNLREFRNQVPTDYVMYGDIVGITKRGSRVKDVSYKMTLKLVNIESGLVEWQDQKDIRKKEKSSLFGS